MPEDDSPDIVDQIDELTGDAASWSATGGDDSLGWDDLTPGAMVAVVLDSTFLGALEISLTDPISDLVDLVGDPLIARVNPLRSVQFWVGKNSGDAASINRMATRILNRLLRDVRDGDYIASDAERESVRTLLDDADGSPVICGPCVITGATDIDTPGPLGDNFRHWYAPVRSEIIQMSRAARVASAVANELGLPLEGIVIISSGPA
jgi:hypothetical protein